MRGCSVLLPVPAARVVCPPRERAVTNRSTGSAAFRKGTANCPTGSANSFDVFLSIVLAESILSVVCQLSLCSAVTAGSAFCVGSGIRFLPSLVSLFCTSLIITPLCVDHKDHVRRSDEISPYTYRWQNEKSDILQKKNALASVL